MTVDPEVLERLEAIERRLAVVERRTAPGPIPGMNPVATPMMVSPTHPHVRETIPRSDRYGPLVFGQPPRDIDPRLLKGSDLDPVDGWNIPDDPTDDDIRRAADILASGRHLGGRNITMALAIIRYRQGLGHDTTGGEEAKLAYGRVQRVLAPRSPRDP